MSAYKLIDLEYRIHSFIIQNIEKGNIVVVKLSCSDMYKLLSSSLRLVQVHLTCCKGLIDCEWNPNKTKGWKESILTYSFLKCIFSNWKVWQNNNLTLITTKLKYTFDLNSLPLSSSPVSLMKFLNVQNYNALEKLDKD